MGEVIRFRSERPAQPDTSPHSQPRPQSRPRPAQRPEPLWREVIGRELRGERLRQQRTLADVAQEAGVSTQYLSEIERGLKEASSEILGAVRGALGLRLVDLTERMTRSLTSAPSGPTTAPSGPLALAASL